MVWLLLGTAILALFLVSLRAFERASVASIRVYLQWTAALGGILLALLLLLSGRGAQALTGLVMVGPLLWRQWHQSGAGRVPPPPRSAGAMSRDEAYEVLGLKPGASHDDIRAAHRRLMRGAHPDSGGSDWLASRINQARDVLLD